MFSQEEALQFKLVMIGDPSTGKSSIIRRYCDDKFTENYSCTIGVDTKTKPIKISDCLIKLQIWDTAGQERFKPMTRSYYKKASGCLIVYDVTRKSTFDSLYSWATEFHDNHYLGYKPVVAIVGNKSDLELQREVSTQEGQSLAASLGCLFYEVTAKVGGHQITQMYLQLGEKILKRVRVAQKKENPNLFPDEEPNKKKPITGGDLMRQSKIIQRHKKTGCCS